MRTGLIGEMKVATAMPAMPLALPTSMSQPPMEERRARADGVCEFICRMGSMPADSDVLAVLQGWGFAKNTLRPKLCKDGKWCHSDTFGLTKMQGVHIVRCTERFTSMHKFLAMWIRWKVPEAVFTTIVVNYNFQCLRHRDGRNVGPTVLLAIGAFTGGALRLWPGDSGETDVGKLKVADAKVVELEHQKGEPYLFDGNCAHEVLPFEGERFSVMAFSLKGYEAAAVHEVEKLKQMGYPFPTDAIRRACIFWFPCGGCSLLACRFGNKHVGSCQRLLHYFFRCKCLFLYAAFEAGLVKLRRMCGPVVAWSHGDLTLFETLS